MARHNQVGNLGEQLIAVHLAQIAPVEISRIADLSFAGSVEIEVKTSRASLYNGRNRGYQFLLSKRDRYGVTNFRKADVLVLVCLDDDLEPVATYVLPTARLRGDRMKITIPVSLSSPFHVFRDYWGVIGDVIADKEKNDGD